MPDERKYRIQRVAEMTGLAPATLRAWERRYGIPLPMRTASSYRVYSDADVAQIERLRKLCDDGLAPSEAAKIVLAEQAEAACELAPDVDEDGDGYAPFRAAIMTAVDALDSAGLERALRQSLALGAAQDIYERILRPSMIAIGERWEAGSLSIAHEHMAAQLFDTATRQMLALVQPSASDRAAVLACFAHERHTLPLLGAALHVAPAGFRVIMLGACTPPVAIAEAVARLRPDFVGLSVTTTPPAPLIEELCRDYARACEGFPWVVGGRAAAALRDPLEEVGAGIVADLPARALVHAIERTIARHRHHVDNDSRGS